MRIALEEIAAAAERIAGYVEETPLRLSEWLSTDAANVFFKLEVVQPTSSYKIRGAFNTVIRASGELSVDQRLVTASAGNHGRGMAYAGSMHDVPLVVFVPVDAPRAKIDAIANLGAELRS